MEGSQATHGHPSPICLLTASNIVIGCARSPFLLAMLLGLWLEVKSEDFLEDCSFHVTKQTPQEENPEEGGKNRP